MSVDPHIIEVSRLEMIIYKLVNQIKLNERENEIIDNILGKKEVKIG
jgi:hypothetical protein